MAGGISGSTVDFVLHPLDTLKTCVGPRARPQNSADSVAPPRPAPRPQAATGAQVAGPNQQRAPLSRLGQRHGRLLSLCGHVLDRVRGQQTILHGRAAQCPGAAGARGSGLHRCVCLAWAPAVGGNGWALTASASAEVFTAAVRNPFEVVKQQMQAGMHSSTPDAIRSLVRAEGVRGFYAGYLTLVARDIPFDALQFTLYEFLKSSWARFVGRDLTLTDNAALGCEAWVLRMRYPAHACPLSVQEHCRRGHRGADNPAGRGEDEADDPARRDGREPLPRVPRRI